MLFICKQGQRYSGAYGLSPAAGKRTAMPIGFTGDSAPKPGQSENVELRNLMERLQQYIYRFRVRAKDFFKVYPIYRLCSKFY